MIDPLVSLLMPPEDQATQNDISHYIQVEEALDCRNSNKRFFSLLNRESFLNIIISEQSTIISCKLDRHEIVVDRTLYNETHETWAIGDRPYQRLSNLAWNSHVRGSELVLSSSTSLLSSNLSTNNSNSSSSNNNNFFANSIPHTSLYYELTRSNELNCMGKLKSIHMQHQVFYFNLNRASTSRAPIDGHLLAVKCSGDLNQIHMQPTKLLCHCAKFSPPAQQLAHSLISDIPHELVQQTEPTVPDNDNLDDIILCDAIYSLESTSPTDYIKAQLQFNNRKLVFEVRSVKSASAAVASNASGIAASSSSGNNNNNNNNNNSSSNNNNNNSSSSNVSSSTTNRGKSRASNSSNIDLMQQPVVVRRLPDVAAGVHRTQSSSSLSSSQQVDDSIATSSSPSFDPAIKLESSSSSSSAAAAATASSTAAQPTSSSEIKYQFANNNAKVAHQGPTSSQHPSTMLRIRIRATNFGVCILPHMMTNYTCSYKFDW